VHISILAKPPKLLRILSLALSSQWIQALPFFPSHLNLSRSCFFIYIDTYYLFSLCSLFLLSLIFDISRVQVRRKIRGITTFLWAAAGWEGICGAPVGWNVKACLIVLRIDGCQFTHRKHELSSFGESMRGLVQLYYSDITEENVGLILSGYRGVQI
jgi:hypothetical protein